MPSKRPRVGTTTALKGVEREAVGEPSGRKPSGTEPCPGAVLQLWRKPAEAGPESSWEIAGRSWQGQVGLIVLPLIPVGTVSSEGPRPLTEGEQRINSALDLLMPGERERLSQCLQNSGLEQLALTVVRAPDDIARLLRAVAAEEKLLKEGGELPRWRRAALGKGQLSLHRTGVRGGIVPATDSPPQAVVPLLTRVLTNEALERDKLLGGVFGEQGAPTLPSAPETPKQLVESSGALLGSILTQEIEAASPPEVRDPDELTGVIKVILKMVSDSRDPMIASINRFLGSLEGKSFDSFEANQRFTAQVSDLARGLGLRFECQKPGCGAASTLVLLPGNARTGAFAFRHSGTNHGGRATIPSLRLVQEHHSVTS